MRRQNKIIKKGTLVKNIYSFEEDYGVTTSEIEYHSQPGTTGRQVAGYVWVLWGNGEHCLFKTSMLEEVNESR